MSVEPMVSCLCPTYNRFPARAGLLQECVYWFLRQEYERKELIILNDTPGQFLTCDAPGVRCINVPRIPTLGEKRNRLLDYARGDIVLPWDDDDINLPGRIRQCVNGLDGFHYYNPQGYWYEQAGELIHTHSIQVGHNCSAFWRGELRYEKTSGNEDMRADAYAKAALKCNLAKTTPHDWQYVYRWGVSPTHISGFKDMQAAYNRPPDGKPGLYTIVPTMGKDYVVATRNILAGS